ncbi:Uu.00g010540.m01.CDS01 [Anthostomella pinea]|uniref:Uu.00g010540.m01.CDS01 n=1 Tax=Anthostomella pinea TaxID=933095 RepID=A0AAI8YQ32_9PEZI|nr:Uu.00g010540.m01.CDS01 [Anthostomella pinea]
MQTQTQSSGSGPASYPPLPASPTLTNPDMILPDYDDMASSPDRSHSPLIMWKNAHVADMQFDLSTQSFTTGLMSPTTPIIYGNGTMLSDIGEVTEVESTCPTRSRSASIRNDFPTRSTPTMTYDASMKKELKLARERRASIDSTSTVTANEQVGLFADFDDSVSIDDSNFQGDDEFQGDDDEESVADSYIDDAEMQESISPARELPNGFGEERYSTALSRRAEQILANAKRRLTTMEGNLSRARTSLNSPTLSSLGSDATPSPPMIRPATTVYHENDASHRENSHAHTRVSSEGNLPTERKPNAYAQRSSSALGSAGGYRQPLQTSRSAEYRRDDRKNSPNGNSIYGNASFAKTKMSLRVIDRGLEPLSEDEPVVALDSSRPSLEDDRVDSFLTPTFGTFQEKSLRRSASSAHIGDLKDQMNDLKGRLSTLRDQARADSMKRRSLQSLRTPSPFTHAHQWYAETNGHDESDPVDDDPNSHPTEGDNSSANHRNVDHVGHQRILEEDEESLASGYTDAEEDIPPTRLTPAGTRAHAPDKSAISTMSREEEGIDYQEDMKTEDGYDDAVPNNGDDSGSESGESSYHDSVQNQVSHEDREDAFDYEHFFLHSAMGSMSQKRLNRSGSFSSEESVETTKGPTPSAKSRTSAGKNRGRSRPSSTGSISTIESFATATEGRITRADNKEIEDYHEQVVELPHRARTHTPETARRTDSASERSDSGSDGSRLRKLGTNWPQSSASSFSHRPSVSSLESTGTTRSFPLVNRAKMNDGVLTPRDSPDQVLKQISEALMNDTASICESVNDGGKTAPIEMLQKEDQILVERLIADLGRCVLGLAEAGRASTESRVYRRKIEAARRILEGLDDPAL